MTTNQTTNYLLILKEKDFESMTIIITKDKTKRDTLGGEEEKLNSHGRHTWTTEDCIRTGL